MGRIKQIEKYVEKVMSSETAHDFKHVNRVRNWALLIARNENFKDMDMVEVAALMHDVGLPQANPRNLHGKIGAEMTTKYLTDQQLFNEDDILEISNAIKYHNKNRVGEGLLLNIIRDADAMDLFGATGIMRAYTSKSIKPEYDIENIKGETWTMSAIDFDKRFDNGTGIGKYITDQINFQISCYDNLQTATAKQLAKPLVQFMKRFMIQLENEIIQL